MAQSLAPPRAFTHQDRLQAARPVMAKADLKNLQKHALWLDDAADCALAITLSHLSHKEAAARLGLSESGLSAQLAGAERPQTERWRADETLRAAYVIAHAMRHPDLFTVETTITVRRTA